MITVDVSVVLSANHCKPPRILFLLARLLPSISFTSKLTCVGGYPHEPGSVNTFSSSLASLTVPGSDKLGSVQYPTPISRAKPSSNRFDTGAIVPPYRIHHSRWI